MKDNRPLNEVAGNFGISRHRLINEDSKELIKTGKELVKWVAKWATYDNELGIESKNGKAKMVNIHQRKVTDGPQTLIKKVVASIKDKDWENTLKFPVTAYAWED